MPSVVVLDYGSGNLRSAQRALERAGATVEVPRGFEDNRIYDRPDGSLEHYDKRHLFRMANEQQHYAAGTLNKITVYAHPAANIFTKA